MIKLILQKLGNNNFVKSVLIVSGGTAISQLILVLLSPVLTRLYTPSDFGVFAVYSSILMISLVIACGQYELAIPLSSDENSANSLVKLCFLILLGVTLLGAVFLVFFSDALLEIVNTKELQSYLWILPISLFSLGTFQIMTYLSLRKKRFNRIAVSKIAQSGTIVITQLLLGIGSFGPFGLILGDTVGRGVGANTIFLLNRSSNCEQTQKTTLRKLWKVARRWKNFPLLSMPAQLFNVLGMQLPVVLFAAYYGTEFAGFFVLGQRVVGMPMALIGQSVAQVFFSEGAALKKENSENFALLFNQISKKLFIVGLLPIALIAIGAPMAFELIFGDVWVTAGDYVRLMSVMFVAQFIAAPLSQTLYILEKQGLALFWNVARLILSAGSIVICSYAEKDDYTAVAVYSVCMLISYIMIYLFCLHSVRNYKKLQ